MKSFWKSLAKSLLAVAVSASAGSALTAQDDAPGVVRISKASAADSQLMPVSAQQTAPCVPGAGAGCVPGGAGYAPNGVNCSLGAGACGAGAGAGSCVPGMGSGNGALGSGAGWPCPNGQCDPAYAGANGAWGGGNGPWGNGALAGSNGALAGGNGAYGSLNGASYGSNGYAMDGAFAGRRVRRFDRATGEYVEETLNADGTYGGHVPGSRSVGAMNDAFCNYMRCKFGYFIPTGGAGHGIPWVGHYSRVYPVNPYYSDSRDGQVWSAQGYGVPVSVPLAPVVGHTWDYGWGVPSSRLTPISRPAY